MAENKKYGRVWIPSEEFWDLAIPMPEDVTEIKDPQHLYWHLEGWLEEMLLQSSEAEEEAHNLVSELQKLGMCSPELSWRKLAEGDFSFRTVAACRPGFLGRDLVPQAFHAHSGAER